MTTSFYTRLEPVTILNGQANSREIDLVAEAHDAYMISIMTPDLGADAALTYKIQVAPNREDPAGGETWRDLVDSLGNVINAPGSLQARIYTEFVAFGRMRIVASGNVTADRTFAVSKADTL